LVPGLAGSWKLLWPLARRLARYFEVFTYGLREDTTGMTPGRDPCRAGDIEEYAHDLAALVARLGIPAPTVFGVSFGGAIALQLAVDSPESVGSLIVHGAESRFHPSLASTIARRVLERFPLPSNNRFVNQFFHLLYGAAPEPGPLVDFVIERIWETDQSVMAHRLALLDSFDVSDRLWSIQVPTLVLAGARDVVVPPTRQQALARAILGARCEIIPDSGHIGFLTHRASVVRRIRRHFQKVGATA
jgi:pimeloyl-ACP methyl ester carboxylesterase